MTIEIEIEHSMGVGDYLLWRSSWGKGQKVRAFKVHSVNKDNICLQSLKSPKNNTVSYSFLSLTAAGNAVVVNRHNFGGTVWALGRH